MVRASQEKALVRQIAIFDAKNFYCSVESVFDLSLRGKPLVVLSNNDGCPVSRSDEAKALGIEMGVAWFKYKDLAKKYGIIAKSSNYPLYADMSIRLMRVLKRYCPDQEVYSVDECFLDFTTFKRINVTQLCHDISRDVLKGLGLPVRAGVGTTKTLAKLANHCAKKRAEFKGVCNFNDMTSEEVDRIMSETAIEDLWGVGKKLAPRLRAMGIQTVLDLKRADPNRLRDQFSVLMEKSIRELNGVACIEMEEVPPPRKQIISSKSFGMLVTELEQLEAAVTAYMTSAAEKLRRQKSAAGSVHVFIHTHRFREDLPKYGESITVPLPSESDDTRRLVAVALWGLRKIYLPGFHYAKAGVMLSEIVPIEGVQTDLFSRAQSNPKSDALMSTMDAINKKYGKATIKLASEGTTKKWTMRAANKSPCYTTRWEDLPVILD